MVDLDTFDTWATQPTLPPSIRVTKRMFPVHFGSYALRECSGRICEDDGNVFHLPTVLHLDNHHYRNTQGVGQIHKLASSQDARQKSMACRTRMN